MAVFASLCLIVAVACISTDGVFGADSSSEERGGRGGGMPAQMKAAMEASVYSIHQKLMLNLKRAFYPYGEYVRHFCD